MACVQRVLIVAGEPGGMSLAMCLRREGINVDLIDRDPEWRAEGRAAVTEASRRSNVSGKLLDWLAAPPDDPIEGEGAGSYGAAPGN